MMKIKTLIFIVTICCTNDIFAVHTNINGIYYNLDNVSKTAEVISNPNKYKGTIFIPSSVLYDETMYVVTAIKKAAFSECKDLISLTIPNSVTTIEEYAFYECSNLSSISIGNSLATIGIYAFTNCSSLTSITIPNSVRIIEPDAFYGCTGLLRTNYTGNIAEWCKIKFYDNPIHYSHNFYINDVEINDLVIPNGVDTIGDGAFSSCTSLTSVTIPNSVTTIGSSAFRDCSSLTSITIPNSVTTIGDYVLYGCNNLNSPIYANNILAYFPQNYSGSYTIPYGTKQIIGGAFSNCKFLTFVNIPNTVISIGSGAFEYCTNLTSITIPNSITRIEDKTFYNCNGLTTVEIPNSVTWIGNLAFSYCNGLSSIIIGKYVTQICYLAFGSCTELTSITCHSINPPLFSSDYFGEAHEYVFIYVPIQSVDDYKQSYGWKDFTNIQPIAAEEVPVTDPIITPDNHSVTITWPQTDNTNTYTLEIHKNGELVCTLTFNNQGIMINITFDAPARGGKRTASEAEMTVNGYKFTITGLEPGTEYTYTITAKNASAQPIQTYSGQFRTTDTTGLENLTIDKKVGNKFIYGNQLYLRRGDKIYNAAGVQVK